MTAALDGPAGPRVAEASSTQPLSNSPTKSPSRMPQGVATELEVRGQATAGIPTGWVVGLEPVRQVCPSPARWSRHF